MADGFDMNDRTTWNWVGQRAGPVKTDGTDGEYCLDKEDRHSFYQYSSGVPYKHSCPREDTTSLMVFNPEINVCDFQANCPESSIYDWCVVNGYVAPDQR